MCCNFFRFQTHIRSVAEKSEMVARLALMEAIQKENQNLKLQNEKLTRHNEQLSKNVQLILFISWEEML